MGKNLITSCLYTLVSTIVLGLCYPLLMTGLAQTFFRAQANGQLVTRQGIVIGSRLIGQPFTGAGYFHGRPSAAGATGYDASSSGGSNYGPTNKNYIDRVKSEVAELQRENPDKPAPIDMVTASGSGLDPDITPAAAAFQILRIAKERGIPEEEVKELIAKHTRARQFGFLGEPCVNVLELNLALDATTSPSAK